MQRIGWLAAAAVALAGCTAAEEEDTNGSSPTQTSAMDSESGSDSAAELGCAAGAMGETSDGATESLQDTWGAACTSDAECVGLLGEGAICETTAVIYELPGGYCTKPCSLPDATTRAVPDDPTCDPAGGVACIGLMGMFERCTPLCTDDAQCGRDGYICRRMPLISSEADPKSCLMPDCCEGSCSD